MYTSETTKLQTKKSSENNNATKIGPNKFKQYSTVLYAVVQSTSDYNIIYNSVE